MSLLPLAAFPGRGKGKLNLPIVCPRLIFAANPKITSVLALKPSPVVLSHRCRQTECPLLSLFPQFPFPRCDDFCVSFSEQRGEGPTTRFGCHFHTRLFFLSPQLLDETGRIAGTIH